MNASETFAAMLTPHGRGAVAVIAVRGPQAEACVQMYFRAANGRSVALQQLGRIVFGRWSGESGEEVLLMRRSPGSLEVHCHGGIAAPTAILNDLKSSGCQFIDAWELSAAMDADVDRRDALIALADATTERTAAILLDQSRGVLTQALAEIETAVAAGDPSSEDRARADRLLALADVGRHLTRPWRVVIAGQPNVGKSSLMNALVGHDRAIVFDAPGTTRDTLSALTAIDGWPVEISDTAGIRETCDHLELQAIERARQRLSAAELVVLVFDLSLPWSADDERLQHAFPDAIVVHNKLDTAAAREESQRPAGLRLSARTGAGLGKLVQEIGRRLVPTLPIPGEAVPFTESQIDRLLALRGQLDASG